MTHALLKQQVRDFWEAKSCGEVYAEGDVLAAQFAEQARERYRLEPYIPAFARFEDGRGRDVLEIGVGMGADHVAWAKARPASLTGIDLTARAVEFTRARLELMGLSSSLHVGDAERIDFADDRFDLVYSWGVLHHSPDTPRAIREVWRVLRPGGVARVMIYHTYALTGYMLWARFGLMAGRPGRSLADIYANHLESPGTKAYSIAEAKELFAPFERVDVRTQLAFGDLLEGAVGQRHRGPLLSAAKALWPRWLIRRAFRAHGLYLLIDATK